MDIDFLVDLNTDISLPIDRFGEMRKMRILFYRITSVSWSGAKGNEI